MSLLQLPYTILGLYNRRRPKVPLITTASTPEDAERNREQMELSINGCPVVYRSPNGSKVEKYRRLAILDNNYKPLASGSYAHPSNAATTLSKHSKEPTFLIVYNDVNEIKKDKWGNLYIFVYQFRVINGPDKTKTIGDKTFTVSTKRVIRINRWKVNVEL